MIGSVSAHYGYDYDFVYSKISFQSVTLLNASIPKFKKMKKKKEAEDAPQDLTAILSAGNTSK